MDRDPRSPESPARDDDDECPRCGMTDCSCLGARASSPCVVCGKHHEGGVPADGELGRAFAAELRRRQAVKRQRELASGPSAARVVLGAILLFGGIALLFSGDD